MSDLLGVPPLPPGREIELPGRGTTFVRELPGPPGAPTLLLLHGWTATADLNWFGVYEELGKHFRIVAMDHRGHGQGIRTRKPFRLADCADDAACLVSELGLDEVIPVGYSMGGPIALLMWRRHRPIVRGLVLCATAGSFSHSRAERMSFLGLTGLGALARLTPSSAKEWITERSFLRRKADRWGPWAISQIELHDWRMVLEAGHAIGSFSATEWLPEIDVPTSHVVTLRDPVIPTYRQLDLVSRIQTAEAVRIDAEHDAIVAHSDRMAVHIVEGAQSVLRRSAPSESRAS
ncbi:MAG: alpha/beta fold hydrolase [Actinomycetota bacterium]